jgi:hypothetical protein
MGAFSLSGVGRIHRGAVSRAEQASRTLSFGDQTFEFGQDIAGGDRSFITDIGKEIAGAGETGTLNITGEQIERLRTLSGGSPEAEKLISGIESRTVGTVARTEAREAADVRTLQLARRRGRASTILTSPSGARGALGV